MSLREIQQFRRFIFTVAIGVSFCFSSHGFAQTPPRQQLHNHMPEIVSHLTPVGQLPAARQLNLAVGLPLRNETELNDFLKEVSDPSSPNYRHYLTPEQFAEKFGPTEQDYETVKNFFQTNGFAITGEHSNRVVLDVSGSVANIQRVFHTTLRTYQHPTENRIFFAPDIEPSIDLSVRLSSVSGLTDYPKPMPRIIPSTNGVSSTFKSVGSGPGNDYIGNDFRATYAPGVTLTGAGQTVALVQFDGYYLHDITNYENLIGKLPNNYVTLTNVLVDGFSGKPITPLSNPLSGNSEVSLDIEMVISMAPGVSKIILYEGNPTNSPVNYFFPNDVLNRIATDDLANQISSSWGWSGGPDPTTEQIFKQMMAQGQTYFNASGDSDAFTNNQVDDPTQICEPSSSTNIVQVGGTTLLSTNPISEQVWNWGLTGSGKTAAYVGSSGGISPSNTIPNWQTGINMTANLGSTTRRNIPDVALTADNVYVLYGNGNNGTFGGTSCAAPLWAGFTALMNQYAANAGQPSVGFINPAIYAIGKSVNYAADFNDVTTGNNFWTQSPSHYPAVAGYDLCTGWGTPNGMNLITALATPDTLGVLPGTALIISGPVGGPFTPSLQIFFLTNSGGTLLNWSLSGVPPWLNASAAGGTLTAGGGVALTMNLNSTASNLLAGIYSTNLTFTNLNTQIAQSRSITFQPGQSVVQNGGFENTAFVPWAFEAEGDITLGGDNFIGSANMPYSTGANYIHSGNYAAFLGEPNNLDFLSQIFSTVPGQSYLLSFWLRNPSGAPTNQFVVNWNTNLPATNRVFYVTNMLFTTWTNPVLILTATGTNTMLQFGAQNNFDYFGFDDVSLQPIPVPTFRTIVKSNNIISFTLNSLSNIQYQVQYATNLAQTNWFILGTNTATDFTLTVTNAIGTNQSRFYRIRRLP